MEAVGNIQNIGLVTEYNSSIKLHIKEQCVKREVAGDKSMFSLTRLCLRSNLDMTSDVYHERFRIGLLVDLIGNVV
jgi:hypothetical protein